MPVKLGVNQTMAWAVNFQAQYSVISNITGIQYPPILSRSRDKREEKYNDRALAYKGIESIMNR